MEGAGEAAGAAGATRADAPPPGRKRGRATVPLSARPAATRGGRPPPELSLPAQKVAVAPLAPSSRSQAPVRSAWLFSPRPPALSRPAAKPAQGARSSKKGTNCKTRDSWVSILLGCQVLKSSSRYTPATNLQLQKPKCQYDHKFAGLDFVSDLLLSSGVALLQVLLASVSQSVKWEYLSHIPHSLD